MKAYPKIAEFDTYLKSKYSKYNKTTNKITEEMNNAQRILENKKNNQNKIIPSNNAININLKNIYDQLQSLNSEMFKSTEKLLKINAALKPVQYENNIDSNDLLKSASFFKREHITITEEQDPGHSCHLLTITNNTYYHWKELILYIPTNKSSFDIRIELKPKEILNKTVEDALDYNYELLIENGTYSMHLLYCSLIVSNDVHISRILIKTLQPIGSVHRLTMKNNHIMIGGCTLMYQSESTGNCIQIKCDFPHFKEKTVDIQNLIRNDVIIFAVYKGNLLLSEQKRITVP